MQKVSKQSLAMLALSILLAISIALTFTFAALGQSKTATGTIVFSGNYTITMTGVTEETASLDNNWEFEGTFNADGTITLPTTPTVKFTNVSAGATMYYAINITTSGSNAEHITVNYTTENGKANNSTEASVSVALSSLINGNATIDWESLVTSSTDASGYEPLTFNVSIKVGNAASDVAFA